MTLYLPAFWKSWLEMLCLSETWTFVIMPRAQRNSSFLSIPHYHCYSRELKVGQLVDVMRATGAAFGNGHPSGKMRENRLLQNVLLVGFGRPIERREDHVPPRKSATFY